MTQPEVDQRIWSDTQAWLDGLDRPAGAAHTRDTEPDQLPTELDIDDRPHDLDEATASPQPQTRAPAPTCQQTPRFNKSVALTFAAATLVATTAVTSVLLAMRTAPHTATENSTPATQISILPAPPSTASADPSGDTPIPFTAAASCPPGSTAAQAVAGDDPSRAWVCVRDGADGQVLHLDLGRSMVITAVSVTPGWVGVDASGADQWPAHRVVTRMQWIFNDEAATVVTQTTGSVRGDAVQALPHRGVLASKVTAIVLETTRAPSDPAPTTTSPLPGGLLDTVLGQPATLVTDPAPPPVDQLLPLNAPDYRPTDPADTTVAISSVKILGHPPQ